MSPSEQHDTPEAARREERQGFLDLEQGEPGAALPLDQPLPAPHKWPARVRATQPASTQHDAPDPVPGQAALLDPAPAAEAPPAVSAIEAGPALDELATAASTGTESASIESAAANSQRQPVAALPSPDASTIITMDSRIVKFAAWMLGLTAGFGCVIMVCAIWILAVLLHPPVPPASSPSAAPTARTGLVPPAPAASAPLAAAAPAKTETASAASVPALVHHHHHKIKPKPKPKARTTT